VSSIIASTIRRRTHLAGAMLVVATSFIAGCATAPRQDLPGPDRVAPMNPPRPEAEFQRGKASWYGPGFHGKRTASGERFDMEALTAAHRTLPFGTRIRVRNSQNGREVVVRINDRGPFARGRVLDLSKSAAAQIGLIHRGSGRVELALLD
jgi:rare lipoprotein A